MVSESETCTCAARRDFKLIHDFFPQFEGADALVATAENDGSEKLTKVEFAPADRWHFEVVVAHVLLLEGNNAVSKLNALVVLVVGVSKLQVGRQLNLGLGHVRVLVSVDGHIQSNSINYQCLINFDQ